MAITFDQLRLLVAIGKVDQTVPDKSQPRSRYVELVRDEFCRMHGDVLFPFSTANVSDLAIDYRKGGTKNNTRLKADIAENHGYQCFWKNREKGPCSEEAEAGHVCPGSEGYALTVANGMIECKAHNRQRSTMSIEQYLLSDKTTKGGTSDE